MSARHAERRSSQSTTITPTLPTSVLQQALIERVGLPPGDEQGGGLMAAWPVLWWSVAVQVSPPVVLLAATPQWRLQVTPVVVRRSSMLPR
jgi:hypothetical protein